jgi:hypothetical protein
MSEPTIDEMLAFLNNLDGEVRDGVAFDIHRLEFITLTAAIRAILEQHRDSSMDAIRAVISEERGRDLLVIRAFVERVNERYLAWGDVGAYGDCVRDELAEMEKETDS